MVYTPTGLWAMDFFDGASRKVNTFVGQMQGGIVANPTPPAFDVLAQRDPKDVLAPKGKHKRRPLEIPGSLLVAEKDHPSDQTRHHAGDHTGIPNLVDERRAQHLSLKDQTRATWFVLDDHLIPVHPHHHDSWVNPRHIVDKLWHAMVDTVGNVTWTYHDFVAQFQKWDGSLSGLLTHVELWWRTFEVILLTVVILELFPLMEALGRLLRMVGSLIGHVFQLGVSAMEELWYFLGLLWDDLWKPFQWVM